MSSIFRVHSTVQSLTLYIINCTLLCFNTENSQQSLAIPHLTQFQSFWSQSLN